MASWREGCAAAPTRGQALRLADVFVSTHVPAAGWSSSPGRRCHSTCRGAATSRSRQKCWDGRGQRFRAVPNMRTHVRPKKTRQASPHALRPAWSPLAPCSHMANIGWVHGRERRVHPAHGRVAVLQLRSEHGVQILRRSGCRTAVSRSLGVAHADNAVATANAHADNAVATANSKKNASQPSL